MKVGIDILTNFPFPACVYQESRSWRLCSFTSSLVCALGGQNPKLAGPLLSLPSTSLCRREGVPRTATRTVWSQMTSTPSQEAASELWWCLPWLSSARGWFMWLPKQSTSCPASAQKSIREFHLWRSPRAITIYWRVIHSKAHPFLFPHLSSRSQRVFLMNDIEISMKSSFMSVFLI